MTEQLSAARRSTHSGHFASSLDRDAKCPAFHPSLAGAVLYAASG
jgi:hypothetical protein